MTECREPRLDIANVATAAYTCVLAFDNSVTAGAHNSGLEPAVLHLVRIRVSQINGCAFCLELHCGQARRDGETQRRLHLLAAWRRAPLFTERERAALALAEAVTVLPDGEVPEATWTAARAVFDEAELAHLVLAAALINLWNRLAIATRLDPPAQRAG